jgi:hypothetical protein
LLAALKSLDVDWVGNQLIPEMEARLNEGRLFQTPEPRGHTSRRIRKLPEEERSTYHPVVDSYWVSWRMCWEVFMMGSGKTVAPVLVHSLAQRLVRRRLNAMEHGGECVVEPVHYKELPSTRVFSRAWLAVQLFWHHHTTVDVCAHCEQPTETKHHIRDSLVALVTGVDETVFQTDWFVYRQATK